MGLELQIEELQEQRQRARVQGRFDDAIRMEREIAQLQGELAVTAEMVAERGPEPEPRPELHDAEKLSAATD